MLVGTIYLNIFFEYKIVFFFYGFWKKMRIFIYSIIWKKGLSF